MCAILTGSSLFTTEDTEDTEKICLPGVILTGAVFQAEGRILRVL
jgi:hypothetical protein